MPVRHYSLFLMDDRSLDGHLVLQADQMLTYLRAWRKSHAFATTCSQCQKKLPFALGDAAFDLCCQRFYFDSGRARYPIRAIVVPTPGFEFVLPQMKKALLKHDVQMAQDFVVIPDPIYWQLRSTLVIEKVMKFALRLPMTQRTQTLQPASKASLYYRQLQEMALNYGSILQRSCGKGTFLRQIGCGKRCELAMRFMIVADASLRPNEVALPDAVCQPFDLAGRWIILNRMPSLQPGNFVALRVRSGGPRYCIGIPLEIVDSLNADFDGDECNVYVLRDVQSQAECQEILNSERRMGSFTTELMLAPSQDALVAYRLYYDRIDFLPFKLAGDLKKTFRVLFELYGSKCTFDCFDRMRHFYREVLHRDRVFGITLQEIYGTLLPIAQRTPSVEEFERQVREAVPADQEGCIVTQIEAGTKASFDVWYQMLGSVGDGVRSSFLTGLSPSEAVKHDAVATRALEKGNRIWMPGYNYSKTVFNIQAMTVDNRGRITDGRSVVERNALDALHATDLVADETFQHLLQVELAASEEVKRPRRMPNTSRGRRSKCSTSTTNDGVDLQEE